MSSLRCTLLGDSSKRWKHGRRGRALAGGLASIVLGCALLAGCSSFGSGNHTTGGLAHGTTKQSAKKPKQQQSWLGSMFASEPAKPKTVNEFLRQDRPQ